MYFTLFDNIIICGHHPIAGFKNQALKTDDKGKQKVNFKPWGEKKDGLMGNFDSQKIGRNFIGTNYSDFSN